MPCPHGFDSIDDCDPCRSQRIAALEAMGRPDDEVTAQIVAWFDAGCPGLDREKFVMFGPLGMIRSMRDAIERGEWRAR